MRKLVIGVFVAVAAALAFAGPGLGISIDGTLGGTGASTAPLGVNTSSIQKRVTGTCAGGTAIGIVNGDGTVSCNTTGGVTGTGTAGDLMAWSSPTAATNYGGSSPAACSAGSSLTDVALSATGVITNTCAAFFNAAGAGLSSSGSTVSANLAGGTCTAGNIATALSSTGALTCTAIGTQGGTTGTGTSNAVAKWSGPTSLGSSLLTDNGTTLAYNTKFTVDSATGNAATPGTLGITGLTTATGGIDSHAGPATVGKLSGTVQTLNTAGTLDDFALGSTTTVLRITSITVLNGLQGGVDGRLLFVSNSTTSSFIAFANEAGTSTAANRVLTMASSTDNISVGGGALLYYDGATARWRVIFRTSVRWDTPLTFFLGFTSSSNSSISGSLSFLGTTNHIRAVGTTGVTFSGSAGSVCSCNSSQCNDIAGTFTIAVGSTACTITLGATFTGADDADCLVSPTGGAAMPAYTTNATQILISTGAAGAKYKYICIGNQ